MTRLKGGKGGFSSTWFYLGLILIVVIFIGIIFMKKTKEGFENTDDSKKPELIYYFMDGCKYCKEFDIKWNDLQKKVNTVKFTKINISKTKTSITSVPTIILKVNDKEVEYTGDRNVDDLQKFIDTNIKSK